jgi:hypothetical protein
LDRVERDDLGIDTTGDFLVDDGVFAVLLKGAVLDVLDAGV